MIIACTIYGNSTSKYDQGTIPALSEIEGKSRQRQITKQHTQKFCVIDSYTQRGCRGTKRHPRESDIEERAERELPGWGQETLGGGDCSLKNL